MHLCLWFVACPTAVWSIRYKRKVIDAQAHSASAVPSPAICVGSNAVCDGNVCCSGYTESLNKSFPCPNADDDFDGCETNVKYDLWNASLLDFSHVVYDSLSAGTADNQGEALMWGVGWWSGQRFDLKVQSVDANGNRVPLDDKTFKAIKPHAEGRLLRFDFHGRAHARLQFNWGLYEDGVWTPIALPWMAVTLMDFDCGSQRLKCEEVISADHSSYEVGTTVQVSDLGAQTMFEDLKISGAENNPHSVLLNDEQMSISAGLVFEGREHFTLQMGNYAWWPRTILFAGICNFQWPAVQTPAPTPLPTPSPTPVPTAPTPSPTPSPTCVFNVISGNCVSTCSCISSSNYPNHYDAQESCAIDVRSAVTLQVKDFITEDVWDALVVNGQLCHVSLCPRMHQPVTATPQSSLSCLIH